MDTNDIDLPDFPWSREAAWTALWHINLKRVGLDPDADNADLEATRVLFRSCFDKAWEAFGPIFEGKNFSFKVALPRDLSHEETIQAIAIESGKQVAEVYKERGAQAMDLIVLRFMEYEQKLRDQTGEG